ncbi:DDE Tnp4 domain-containing protein [Mycena kentingensis (nom. inval.)]|nr:DDE Tnp4 domain-containing protein [Mycena kentingensis (nom. inval.)]
MYDGQTYQPSSSPPSDGLDTEGMPRVCSQLTYEDLVARRKRQRASSTDSDTSERAAKREHSSPTLGTPSPGPRRTAQASAAKTRDLYDSGFLDSQIGDETYVDAFLEPREEESSGRACSVDDAPQATTPRPGSSDDTSRELVRHLTKQLDAACTTSRPANNASYSNWRNNSRQHQRNATVSRTQVQAADRYTQSLEKRVEGGEKLVKSMEQRFREADEQLAPPPFLAPDFLALLASKLGDAQEVARILGGQRITAEWLETLSDPACIWDFRLAAPELTHLAEKLGIPEVFKTQSRHAFSRVEALGLLLARFRTAGDMYALTAKFDRAQSAISECVNELVEFLDEHWEHLLACDSEHLLHPSQMAKYAAAIADKGSPLPNIFGFIDCTIRRICHPTWHQQQAYNGHKKYHSLKYQALMLPNGIIGHLYGAIEGRRNDNFLLSDSALLEKLAMFAFPEEVDENTPVEESTFQIFGDPAYGVGPHIQSPFSGAGERDEDEAAFNAKMSKMRITVEHGFGNVANKWPFLNAGWKMRLYASPVGRYYRVGVLLTNCLNCFHPNQVSEYFDCAPPRLREYLHERE